VSSKPVWKSVGIEAKNEANVLGCCGLWIGLRDNTLEVRVRHFVTWLRLRGLAPPSRKDPVPGLAEMALIPYLFYKRGF
jgi:hypothetical protein